MLWVLELPLTARIQGLNYSQSNVAVYLIVAINA